MVQPKKTKTIYSELTLVYKQLQETGKRKATWPEQNMLRKGPCRSLVNASLVRKNL
jgi:hypothetical protein